MVMLLRLMPRPPVSAGHRLPASGSASRSLNQPTRNSLTALVVGIEVHEALPYRVSTVELALLPMALPLVSTLWVWIPFGERQCIAFTSSEKELRSVGRQSILPKPIKELDRK